MPIRHRAEIEAIEIDVRQILNRIEELKTAGDAPNAVRLCRWTQKQFNGLEQSLLGRNRLSEGAETAPK